MRDHQADEPSSEPKTLVVGSSGHAHVTCVPWADLRQINLKDFETVVLNVAALDDKTIAQLPEYGFFDKIRTELSLLLRSGGKIVALTAERRTIKVKNSWRSNWEWCPIEIGTEGECGNSIEVRQSEFRSYLSKLKRWTFFYFIPEAALTSELTRVFGHPNEVQYSLPADAYIVNRYDRMLAGVVPLLISLRRGENQMYYGITLLPLIAELEQREAMNLILEDLIGKPQRTLPPEWVDQISMPFVDAINAEISNKEAEIDSLLQQIAANEKKRSEIEKWKRLVYATGRELEQVFEEAVIQLGAKTSSARGEEEFIFEHDGRAGIVECKGVGKSISLDHMRQADSHVLAFSASTNCDAKGVLFANAWRGLPIGDRDKKDTQIFPDNVIKHATKREIALVAATQFLEAFCRFLRGEIAGDAVLDAIMEQDGVVTFDGLLRDA